MRYEGLSLSGAERRAIAEYVSGRPIRGRITGDSFGRCGPSEPPMRAPAALVTGAGGDGDSLDPLPVGVRGQAGAWNGWSPGLANTHFQPSASAGITAADVPHLTLKWAFGFPDATSSWSAPTIADGRLFVGSQNGTVYSLDARTGCIIWTFTAHSGVRASIYVADWSTGIRSGAYAAYVADQAGFVYALDAATGRLHWSRKVDEHPLVRLTGSPVVYGGRVYVPTSSYEEGGKPPGYSCCTFRGSVVALDAHSGAVVWKTFTIEQKPELLRAYADGSESWGPSGGAVWSSPTIDPKRRTIYVGVGNAYSGEAPSTTDAILALDLASGSVRWSRQMTPGERDVFGCTPGEVNCGDRPGPDFDFGAAPALVTLKNGRQLIVAGQKSGVLYAVDPDRHGAIVWRYRAGGGSGLGGIQWGIATDDERAYVPVADIYAEEPGGLHAVDLASGQRVWFARPPAPVCGRPSRACSSAQFAAVTAIPGVVFSPSNDGAIRAYSSVDGSVLWQFETNHDFQTLNRVRAQGGSMAGPAPVVAGGMVYVGSGYGTFGLRPGNVLLAFAP